MDKNVLKRCFTTGFGAIVVLGASFIALTPQPSLANETLKIELWDKQDGSQGITLSASEIKAGKVTFEITNKSENLEHEFIMVKSDAAADQLPTQDGGAKVNESALGAFDEFGDIEKGDTKSWDRELTAGRYILFCNEEGHYKAGMETVLNVVP